MIVLMAPDKFAGTLSAFEAAEAMAEGWRHVRPDDDVRALPMADGGEGTLDVVSAAVPGAQLHVAEVADALGRAVRASWLELPDGRGLVESAQACGLHRVAPDDRNPRLATSYGVGQLVAAAMDAHVDEVIVTLGGSATNDGGAGLATALGHRLLRSDGNGVRVGAEFLRSLERVVARPALPVPVTAAVDVDARLLGPDGAIAFAPQKGAGADDLTVLEDAVARLADIAERDVPGGPWRDLPGAGAAGGLGFGLAAFAGANLVPGARVVGRMVGLEAAVKDAAVVITGEGAMDRWSARGKVPGAVGEVARRAGTRLFAIAGRDDGAAGVQWDGVRVLGDAGLRDARRLVVAAAADLAGVVAD